VAGAVVLAALGAKSPQFWHILIEAKKLANADLLRYNGDPRFVHVRPGAATRGIGHESGVPAAKHC
jgi:gamma-glutamyltranspeptidase